MIHTFYKALCFSGSAFLIYFTKFAFIKQTTFLEGLLILQYSNSN